MCENGDVNVVIICLCGMVLWFYIMVLFVMMVVINGLFIAMVRIFVSFVYDSGRLSVLIKVVWFKLMFMIFWKVVLV